MIQAFCPVCNFDEAGGGMELVDYLQEQGYKKSWPEEKGDA